MNKQCWDLVKLDSNINKITAFVGGTTDEPVYDH